MLVKEQGWVLVIDQASNCAGVSLWYNGELKATVTLDAPRATDSMARRLQLQVPQLTAFLNVQLPPSASITQILFEGVRARLVLATVGAFLTCPRIDAKMHQKMSFVESTTWKYWARQHGAKGPIKEIKGCKALRETGFPMEQYDIVSDDVADSILIYLAWRDR